MKRITVDLAKEYDCIIGENLLEKTGEYMLGVTEVCRVMLISDDIVFSLYGKTVINSLEKQGFTVKTFVFKNGEERKNLDTVKEVLQKMCNEKMTRSDAVVALGGGVPGDLAGFAAAVYQRGIKVIQIPTTLLAAVDSSVGGKTGVDLAGAKNQVGAFWQPSLVICDINTLKTLDSEQYACGCAEIIKYAMISGEEFFDKIYKTHVNKMYEEVISYCVQTKRDYVKKDEFDTGERMFLNFGHTIGHAVEACAGYTVSHGKAVAVGMAKITKTATEKGICKSYAYDKLISMLKKYDLPCDTKFTKDQIKEKILVDKKTSGDHICLIVPEKTGKCRIERVKTQDIEKWL